MKLRITGTQTECAGAVDALAACFAVREVSSFYPNRGASVLGRVYVDAEPLLGAAPLDTTATRTGGGDLTGRGWLPGGGS